MNGKTKKKVGAGVAGFALVAGAGIALFGLPGRADPGPGQKDLTIDAAMRSATVEAAAASLSKSYVFPDKGLSLGKQLRAKLQSGGYDGLNTAEKLAETLTRDLQEASHDKHLEVRYFEQPVAVSSPQQEAKDKAQDAVDAARFNFGFEEVGRLKGNIGYIKLGSFARPEGATPRIAGAMSLLANTQALVIDLRECHGGDVGTVMQFASYLFDRPTHLNDMYWRDENRTDARWTTATVPGRRYGSTRTLYLLTSDQTFSGCEDFAYGLKNAGRATLIGQATGGGAHAGSPQRLSAHFMMFVPSGRPISPVTHSDWEGVGVVPNIASAADKAMDLAQIEALKKIVATETDPEWRRRVQHRLDELQ